MLRFSNETNRSDWVGCRLSRLPGSLVSVCVLSTSTPILPPWPTTSHRKSHPGTTRTSSLQLEEGVWSVPIGIVMVRLCGAAGVVTIGTRGAAFGVVEVEGGTYTHPWKSRAGVMRNITIPTASPPISTNLASAVKASTTFLNFSFLFSSLRQNRARMRSKNDAPPRR